MKPIYLCALIAVLSLSACGRPGYTPQSDSQTRYAALDPTLEWEGENRNRLEDFINRFGSERETPRTTTSPRHFPSSREKGFDRDFEERDKESQLVLAVITNALKSVSPSGDGESYGTPQALHGGRVSVFDWDNTVIKNDIGDAMLFWALKNDVIKPPAEGDWKKTSRYMTDAAAFALSSACEGAAVEGVLKTSANEACAKEILSAYLNGKTTGGEEAFSGYNCLFMEPSYAWLASLLAGYSPSKIRDYAAKAIAEALAAKEGAVQTIAGFEGLSAYIRIYPQMADLIEAMQRKGFDVWVVSASPQYIIEPFAALLRIPPQKVIGIRQATDGEGILTYDFQGCGPIKEGENSMITYKQGKRCWINKIIFGEEGESALERNSDPTKRPLFAAGDSDTDVFFMQDATGLRLVINRNKAELMCRALHNEDGKWIINSMFIEPMGKPEKAYPCSKSACVREDCQKAPCLEETGAIIPDKSL